MDCARMIQNVTAIKGTDIIFSAYTRWNVNGETANIFTKNIDDPSGFYIQSLFEKRWDEKDIWLHGNFWGGQTPDPTTTNNPNWDFRMKRIPQNPNEAWNGTLHIFPVRTSATDRAVTNCGGTNLQGGSGGTSGVVNNGTDPLKGTVIEIEGIYRDVKIQQEAGWRALKEENLEEAVALMEPVAELPTAIKDTANTKVNHLVDVAKSFTTKGAIQLRSSKKTRGWLPETIVGYAKPKTDVFTIQPNPTNEQFEVMLSSGDYELRIFDAVGKLIFEQNTEGSLKVNVKNWQNGIYIISLLDKATKAKSHKKVVVQH